MKHLSTARGALLVATALVLFSCRGTEKVDAAAAAPPKTEIIPEPDLDTVRVGQPERFELIAAGAKEQRPEIHATGTVMPDVDRSVPVVSLAAGRVAALNAKLGDDVRKGQVLLRVLSNDISSAFQTYEQAKADEILSNRQLERAKLLYDRGAISLNDLQVAEDTEQKAVISKNAAAQQIKTLGADPDHQDPVIEVKAPVSGTIVEQNVAPSGSVRTPDNQQSLFTIADLSHVWIVCDVYENDLPAVRVGEIADIRLNAYPDQLFHGRISNVGKVLDPAIRTAKVRIEMANPGIMRSGMFVTAMFLGLRGQKDATVPSTAVLHLHDRDWVFVPVEQGTFRRRQITPGAIDGQTQVVLAGIQPGQQVVKNALALSAESEQ